MTTFAATAGARSRALAAARECAVITLAALAYVAVRALTKGDLHEARVNGRRILSLEHTLHLGWERSVQSFVLGHRPLPTLANWVYIWGFWPVLAAAAVYLYARHPGDYLLLRNAVFGSAVIGFTIFAVFPVAPPRLVDPRLVDTVLGGATWYRSIQPPRLTNEYAAMPSLHVGWSLLVGAVLARAIRRPPVYLLAALLPTAMALAVVATANHYVVDALVGSAVAATALVLVSSFRWLR